MGSSPKGGKGDRDRTSVRMPSPPVGRSSPGVRSRITAPERLRAVSDVWCVSEHAAGADGSDEPRREDPAGKDQGRTGMEVGDRWLWVKRFLAVTCPYVVRTSASMLPILAPADGNTGGGEVFRRRRPRWRRERGYAGGVASDDRTAGLGRADPAPGSGLSASLLHELPRVRPKRTEAPMSSFPFDSGSLRPPSRVDSRGTTPP